MAGERVLRIVVSGLVDPADLVDDTAVAVFIHRHNRALADVTVRPGTESHNSGND